MFRDAEQADRMYATLRDRGYTDDDIYVAMSNDTRKRYYEREHVEIEEGSQAMKGAGTGAAIGGTIGGIAGAIVALGTNAIIPGLGLVVAGPLLGALAGAGAGGAAGTLLGALIGAGIPEKHAKVYESGLKEGHILVGVHPRQGDVPLVKGEFDRYGGEHVYL
jgi:hypothetical protein